jgi:hypothetical protein
MKRIIITFLVGAIQTLLSGYTIMKLWAWFIAPTFGIFALTIPQAIGIGLMLSFVVPLIVSRDDMDDDNEVFVFQIIFGLMRVFFALSTGFIVKTFFLV